MSGRIVADASRRGAEAIVVACPMCQSNLDMRRPEINERLGQDNQVPVIFITQAIGLALGLAPTALGLQRHMVPALALQPSATV
jgi:heterodisulfide reductase subunit B